MSDSRIEDAIGKARSDRKALNELLERYRPFLKLIAHNSIGDGIRRREDASDIVQKTLLESYQAFEAFRGETEVEFSAWIKKILRRTIANTLRDNRAGKRDLRRELYLDDQEGSVRLFWWHPAAGEPSPSQSVVMAEAALKLAIALEKLSKEHQVVVQMRHLDGCSIDEICAELGKRPAQVAGLLRRGLAALREHLNSESDWL